MKVWVLLVAAAGFCLLFGGTALYFLYFNGALLFAAIGRPDVDSALLAVATGATAIVSGVLGALSFICGLAACFLWDDVRAYPGDIV